MRRSDFARALAAPACLRSPHFALHHAPAVVGGKLSTAVAPKMDPSVDDSAVRGAALIPKRHARRAVTRSLLKRQVRSALRRHVGRLPAGLWLVRLRAAFDRDRYASAASKALRTAIREEIDHLLAAAALSSAGGMR